MASVLQAPEPNLTFQPLEGAHFQQRSYQRMEEALGHSLSGGATTPPRDDGPGISLDATLSDTADARAGWKTQDQQPICIPTNPGTLLHPGSCTPCAFVFRVAEGQVRNRCTNGDSCGWCHHPSHPRTRGRRQKSGGAAARQKEVETWTEKHANGGGNGSGNGSETSTRDSWNREDELKEKGAWIDGDNRGKTNRSTRDDRGTGKRPARDDRAKNNNQRQRNYRDDRSNKEQMMHPEFRTELGTRIRQLKEHREIDNRQMMPDGNERCNTPDFDEQYACYQPSPVQASPEAPYQNLHGQRGAPAGLPQEDCYGRPIVYSYIPVQVAVPTSPPPEATAYSPVAGQWSNGYPVNTADCAPNWNAQYQPGVQTFAPQPYMMVQLQPETPQSQWTPNRMRIENVGLERPVNQPRDYHQ